MLNIKTLENSWFFKSIILEKWEILFDEWETNDNLYILKIWELSVEKYTSKERKETKILWFIKSNEILWEASMNNNKPKEVKIKAVKKSYFIYINGQSGLNQFSEKYPKETSDLLKYIIHIWNKRLLESNNLITISFKVSKEILNLKEITNKTIFGFIDKLVYILNIDHILYFEKNPIMEDFLTLKYDSREKWKMLDKIVEIKDNKLDILDLKINDFNSFIQKISIWNNDLWFLFFIKNSVKFTENDKKILTSISVWFSWLIKQKLLLEEEKNKKYMMND